MANKIVFDNDYYQTGGNPEITICVSIKYGQHGVTNIYHNGAPIVEGKPDENFCETLTVAPGDDVKVISTVADIRPEHDQTGVDVNFSGGAQPKNDPHNETADTRDIVTYHLSYIMIP